MQTSLSGTLLTGCERDFMLLREKIEQDLSLVRYQIGMAIFKMTYDLVEGGWLRMSLGLWVPLPAFLQHPPAPGCPACPCLPGTVPVSALKSHIPGKQDSWAPWLTCRCFQGSH